ncbi:MAG: endonuclease [Chlorobiaceae bacterium]|nr:endonuclease [Chlorobiaceae bacterium]
MCSVYVIWSEKLKKRYIGSTEDVDKRLNQHNSGKTPFTSRGIPWNKIHVEKYSSIIEARARERFLKSGKGREWLDKMYPDLRKKDVVC